MSRGRAVLGRPLGSTDWKQFVSFTAAADHADLSFASIRARKDGHSNTPMSRTVQTCWVTNGQKWCWSCHITPPRQALDNCRELSMMPSLALTSKVWIVRPSYSLPKVVDELGAQ
eukprot:4355647-Amphidinium_carterae.2